MDQHMNRVEDQLTAIRTYGGTGSWGGAAARVVRLAAGEIMPSQIAIVSSLLLGLAATLGTMVIHGFVVHTIITTLRRNLHRGLIGMRLWVNLTFVMGATLLALAGHLAEIALWAFVLYICGAVTDISSAIYSSAGSYTTSGSDIVLPPRWKLLGPFEAVCGMLMFGVSTAFIFAVIQRLIRARYEEAGSIDFDH
ncbi:MAG: hypothetical protein JO212_07730 [Acetobacteraceae bacterium]|nr:hypothetical protein [Acetobacteraceae bacterium]